MVDLGNLDAEATLTGAESTLRRRRAFEVEDLDLVVHWADLHAEDPKTWPAEQHFRGMPKLVTVGGVGTPQVQDLAIAEMAIARESHILATRWLLADGLDLRHRLPKCNKVLHAGQCEVWVARKVARATRHLTIAEAALVDAAVAAALAGEQPSRIFEILEAKIIEANPEAHEERIRAERARRYVSIGRVDEAGLRHVIARVEHGDAIWVDALLNRIAEILAAQDKAAGAQERDQDFLRSVAFGWLARPAELLALLLMHADDADPQGQARPEGEMSQTKDQGPDRRSGWAAGFPERLLEVLKGFDPRRLRPQAIVYVHLHAAALSGTGGVARVKAGGGPRLPEHLPDLLGAAHVSIKPVIDLNERVSVDCYEMPQWLRERIHLMSPREVFPHSTTVSRNVDMDHPSPYRHPKLGEPSQPGQTGTHNSAPLTRRAHRAKTHLPYRLREPRPGTYVWRTPHNRYLVVDDTGTHRVDESLGVP